MTTLLLNVLLWLALAQPPATVPSPFTLGAATPVTGAEPPSGAPSRGRFVPGPLLGGRYRIVALLGAGGMGEAHAAQGVGDVLPRVV